MPNDQKIPEEPQLKLGWWYVGDIPFWSKEDADRHVAIKKAIRAHTDASIRSLRSVSGNKETLHD